MPRSNHPSAPRTDRTRSPLGALRAAVVLATATTSSAYAQDWEAYAVVPTGGAPRLDAVGLTEGGEVLAMAGSPYDGGPTGDSVVHVTVPGSNVWTTPKPFDGPIIGQGIGVDALGRIVVYGGIDGPDPEGDIGGVWVYDRDEGVLSTLPDRAATAAPRSFAYADDDLHRLYSIGGDASLVGGSTYSTLVQRFDGTTDTWSTLAPLPTGLSGAFAVNDGRGHVLVLGGRESGSTATATVRRYDVATNTWTIGAFADMPAARVDHRAAMGADGRLYVVGGRDGAGTTQSTTFVLDLDANEWQEGPSLAVARSTFALTLGQDDFLYAIGGSNGSGGTNTVERMFTSDCPVAGALPATIETWAGLTVTLHAFFAGSGPMSYQWMRDGAPIFDGPSPSGGTFVGANTHTLRIDGVGGPDEGDYSLVATNACGSDETAAAHVSTKSPAALGSYVWVQRIPTYGTTTSSVTAFDGTRYVGSGTQPAPPHADQPQGVAWNAAGQVVETGFTPGNSVGSAISDAKDGRLVGWWWWPYTTLQGTGYYQHACTWDPVTHQHVDLQPSGWEIGSISATDGDHRHVGTVRITDEDTNSHAAYWQSNVKSAIKLTPSGAWGSYGYDIDEQHQYGATHMGFGIVHASRWSGSAASFEDFYVPGAGRSYLYEADAGLVVGVAYFGNDARAYVWGDQPSDQREFLPAGADSAALVDTKDGYLLGSATYPATGTRVALWEGPDGAMFDLTDAAAPGGYTNLGVSTLDVSDDGHVRVIGRGYDGATWYPLVWHVQPEPLVAEPSAVSLSQGGRHELYIAAGPEHANELYLVLGSATGTSPGIPLDGTFLLPLQFDAYTQWTLTFMGSAYLPGSVGVLDEYGGSHAALSVPPGAAPNLAGAHWNHAFLAWNASGALSFVSNAVSVDLLP